ncbi:MAG: nuclear transport factor 2 family protein [Desulfarculaceae bacterium]|jgi:ketosteroid isomerase-like protein
MRADSQTEAEVRAVIEGQLRAYSEKDLERAMSFFAPEEDLLGIGSGADEIRRGIGEHRQALQRDFDQSQGLQTGLNWLDVSCAGDVSWAAAGVHYQAEAGGMVLEGDARLTTVLQRRGDHWLIVQSHFSLPFQGQAEGESFPQA